MHSFAGGDCVRALGSLRPCVERARDVRVIETREIRAPEIIIRRVNVMSERGPGNN